MKVVKKLRCKRGSAYVQAMVAFLILMTLVATAVEVYGVILLKEKLVNMANETARYIELRGALNSEVYSEFDRLQGITGADDAQLSVDGDFSGGGKLQLEAPFTVTVSATGHLFYLEIPLQGKATGRSEVYHK